MAGKTRGPAPKPNALKRLGGNAGKKKINPDVVFDDDSMPECPEWLDAEARAEWQSVCPALYQAGVLKRVDKNVLAAYCQSYARWRSAEEAVGKTSQVIKSAAGNLYINPYLLVAQSAMKEMTGLAAQLGMTPSGRARIVPDKPGREESLADVLFRKVNEKQKTK